MSFTVENKQEKRTSSLDVQILRKDKKSSPSLYRKLTFSGVTRHFESFLPSAYKFSVLSTHPLIGASVYAQVGLNYTLNYFF